MYINEFICVNEEFYKNNKQRNKHWFSAKKLKHGWGTAFRQLHTLDFTQHYTISSAVVYVHFICYNQPVCFSLFSSFGFPTFFGVFCFQVGHEAVEILFSGLLSLLENEREGLLLRETQTNLLPIPYARVYAFVTWSIATRLLSSWPSPICFCISSASFCSLAAWKVDHNTEIRRSCV